MKYFKNTELAKLYNVSEKSVRNWIHAALDGKIDLQLHKQDSKAWIANTTKNIVLIEKQIEKGKKFKNQRGLRIVSPVQKFYQYYDQKQIIDIISNLTIHREIPTQYSYVDGGAMFWDQYANRLRDEDTTNILTETIRLLADTARNVDRLLEGNSGINVIDLGPGNGLPVKATLERLLKQGKLKKYIAIDGSKEMLSILEHNIQTWFGNTVKFEGYVRDFSYERFDDILVDDFASDVVPTNLVFLLGGTLSNFRSPTRTLQTINSSLGLDDVLVYSGYLDTPETRRYFDYAVRPNQKLRSELILGHLGIDESLYEIEMFFDEKEYARSMVFYPKIDLNIKFELSKGTRSVELRKGKPILLWRHWHHTSTEIIEQFDQNGLGLMQATKTKDQEYMLLIAKIKTST